MRSQVRLLPGAPFIDNSHGRADTGFNKGNSGMKSLVRSLAIAGAVIVAAVPARAGAETIVIYINPMTLERTVVVTETPGRDRVFHCFLPPSDLGCQPMTVRRKR